MARRPTPQQAVVLENIERGTPVDRLLGRPFIVGWVEVVAFSWWQSGDCIMTHRTVTTDNPMVGRTELFRVYPDGRITQH